MILEAIINMVMGLIGGLIGLLPAMPDISALNISGLSHILSKVFIVFPFPLFCFIVGNIVFWIALDIIWAIIEWVYKKIPGVD